MWVGAQALRETVETGHTANVDDLAQLAASCDARFAVVQDNEVQTARVLQQLQSNMEQATNRLQERTDAQVEDVRREQDELRGAVDQGITDLAMRGAGLAFGVGHRRTEGNSRRSLSPALVCHQYL